LGETPKALVRCLECVRTITSTLELSIAPTLSLADVQNLLLHHFVLPILAYCEESSRSDDERVLFVLNCYGVAYHYLSTKLSPELQRELTGKMDTFCEAAALHESSKLLADSHLADVLDAVSSKKFEVESAKAAGEQLHAFLPNASLDSHRRLCSLQNHAVRQTVQEKAMQRFLQIYGQFKEDIKDTDISSCFPYSLEELTHLLE